jgi:hypothetical protein
MLAASIHNSTVMQRALSLGLFYEAVSVITKERRDRKLVRDPLQLKKHCQLFIRAPNETLPVAAMFH